MKDQGVDIAVAAEISRAPTEEEQDLRRLIAGEEDPEKRKTLQEELSELSLKIDNEVC